MNGTEKTMHPEIGEESGKQRNETKDITSKIEENVSKIEKGVGQIITHGDRADIIIDVDSGSEGTALFSKGSPSIVVQEINEEEENSHIDYNSHEIEQKSSLIGDR